jgi:hypothetical protein
VFYPLARGEAEAKGFPQLAIIEVPHPLGSASSDQAFQYGQNIAEAVKRALTERDVEDSEESPSNEDEPILIEYNHHNPLEFFDQVNDYFYRQKWSDGLPIIPPTYDRVQQMLERTKEEPHASLGEFAPSWAQTRVEKLAINAVMAGCKPEYFPVVIAAIKALLDPRLNLYAIQATTNPVTPLIVVNGPIARELGMNSKANVFGQGNTANLTIGRAIRLCMMNIGGALPGEMDRATQGQPGKISFCIAENEEDNPWEPYHVEKGYSKEQNTVSVFGVAGTHNILEQTSTTAQNLLAMIAGSMTPLGINNMTIGGEVLLVMSPEHAKLIKRFEFSKDDVKKFLYDYARVPISVFPEETKKQQLLKRRPKWFANVPDHFQVPVVDYPEDIKILVAGGDGAHTTFMPSFGASSRAVTVPIE